MAKRTANKDSKGDQLIHASPTKNFFIEMITRDISLSDCIMDLLDNSIDGANRVLKSKAGGRLDQFNIKINFSKKEFEISDNCGGITLEDAIDYAFHFGRRREAPADVKRGIGLYGIGMKRAIFKIGRVASVKSQTSSDCFEVSIDVDDWEKSDDWDFDYQYVDRINGAGTRISIRNLLSSVAQDFGDPGFKTNLIKWIARDYSFFIARGLKISVNGTAVPSYGYDLRKSTNITPASMTYKDGGVTVRIVAGLVDEIPNEVPEDLRPDKVERYGWFVICNDRVVVAADKTDLTVWGNDDFKVWHGQYNGFAGFAFLTSTEPKALPWITTKRGIDRADPLYRRAVSRMKEVTEQFIAYTHSRRNDLSKAREAEQRAKPVSVSELLKPTRMKLPQISGPAGPNVIETTISYQKPKKEIDEIRRHIENLTISARDIGIMTFEHYQKLELGK